MDSYDNNGVGGYICHLLFGTGEETAIRFFLGGVYIIYHLVFYGNGRLQLLYK